MMGLLWAAALLLSTLWIIYRIYLVFQKPVEELEEILGLDIPPVPDVALSSITSNSVLLYWKPPENYHSPLRHSIQINGINVGEYDRSDASVQLTGLQPGNYYGIRAIATNAAGNSSYSRLIQVRTIHPNAHQGPKALISDEHNLNKRPVDSRRLSSARVIIENSTRTPSPGETIKNEMDSEEIVTKLTRRLDMLQRQKEDIERQLADEVADAEHLKADLMGERDERRRTVEENERLSLETKKHLYDLDKQCKTTQRKKSAKERVLQQKKAERQKMKDDIVKWESEKANLCQNTRVLQQEKASLHEKHATKIAEVQTTIEEAHAASKTLEESIREWGIKVKELEANRKRADKEQNEEEQEIERRERMEEQIHERKIQELQQEYAALSKMNFRNEAEAQELQEQLNHLMNLKNKEPHLFVPVAGVDYPAPSFASTQRRNWSIGSRFALLPYQNSSYGGVPSAFSQNTNVSSQYGTAFPFHGLINTFPGDGEQVILIPSQVESLTTGMPMSPTANTLLPSNLLGGDDDFLGQHLHISNTSRPSTSLTAQESLQETPGRDVIYQDPQSPLSMTSRSPSLIASPFEATFGLQSNFTESDRLSLRSTTSPFADAIPAPIDPVHSRRLGGLFNFNRQRTKPVLSEPPELGTLKQGQSQSFPISLGEDLFGGSGRRKQVSGHWSNPMTSLLTKSTSGPPEDGSASSLSSRVALGARKSSRMEAGSKLPPESLEPTDRDSSPRPSSTYSHGDILPRPSSDSQPFGWSVTDHLRHRASPLGADWSSIGGGWSASHSRRHSIQHGSTSNLSIGSTPLESENYSGKASQPAPIGTERFQKAKKIGVPKPKLNPAAPSFTARIFTRNESKKTPKGGEVDGEKSKARESEKTKDSEFEFASEDYSPTASRLSKDAYSTMTADSLAESYESLDQSNSGTPSEIATTPKESFMQRITRKSSSSKFGVPWSKDRNKVAPRRSREALTPGDMDEDGQSDHLSKNAESTAGTLVASTPHEKEKAGRGALSWSRVIGKSKARKGEAAPSETSERASEAEVDDA